MATTDNNMVLRSFHNVIGEDTAHKYNYALGTAISSNTITLRSTYIGRLFDDIDKAMDDNAKAILCVYNLKTDSYYFVKLAHTLAYGDMSGNLSFVVKTRDIIFADHIDKARIKDVIDALIYELDNSDKTLSNIFYVINIDDCAELIDTAIISSGIVRFQKIT